MAWSRFRAWPTSGTRSEMESEERQRLALEAAEAGTWDWDLSTGKMVLSDICRRLYGGWLKSEPTYDEWLARVHPADRGRADRAVRDVLAHRSSEMREQFRILHPQQRERWVQSIGKVRFDRGGTPVRMLGVTIDVTARRQAEEAVRESEERYRVLFDMAPVGIILVEPEDGRIIAANTRAHDMLGYSEAEFSQMRLCDVEAALDEESVKKRLSEVGCTDATIQFETKHRRKDGRIVESLAAAHRVDIGGRILIYKMWLDITAQKNVERQLAMAKGEAERADAAKTQFLSAASHDLRQPVQSLFFFHSALAAKLSGHPASPLLDNMQTSLEALRMLLDGLLDISRLHAGTIEVERVSFPIGALFTRLEVEYSARAADKGVDFRVIPSSLWVRSDMALLERLLRNLLDNAIKYTVEGGVVLGCRRQGDSVRLVVADTGPGIPDSRLEDIFHEFVQLGNPERDRTKGLGLGLAIVRQLGQLLDHRVAVSSRIGHGTSFSVTVPVAKARIIGKRRRKRQHTALIEARRRILIVDDEALVLNSMRSMMEAMGWEVLAAGTGQEAVRLVSGRGAPDVIVADYRLRNDETGAQVIHDIRGICGVQVPAIVLTGDTNPDRIIECQQSGFRLLHKPITPQDLRVALAETREGAA